MRNVYMYVKPMSKLKHLAGFYLVRFGEQVNVMTDRVAQMQHNDGKSSINIA